MCFEVSEFGLGLFEIMKRLNEWYAGQKRSQRIFVYVCAIALPWWFGCISKYEDFRWIWGFTFIPLAVLIYLGLGKSKPGK